jgi:hypothetical protein
MKFENKLELEIQKLKIGQSYSWSLDWTTKVTRAATHLYCVSVKAPQFEKAAEFTGSLSFSCDKLRAWIR